MCTYIYENPMQSPWTIDYFVIKYNSCDNNYDVSTLKKKKKKKNTDECVYSVCTEIQFALYYKMSLLQSNYIVTIM